MTNLAIQHKIPNSPNYFADYDIEGPDFYQTSGEAFHDLGDGDILDGIEGYRVSVKLVGAEEDA